MVCGTVQLFLISAPQYSIWIVIKLGIGGSVLAYAIIVRAEENIRITSYAREGLIKRKLAEKAANIIVKALQVHAN